VRVKLAAPAVLLVSVAIAGACASMETPPGGPPDAEPAVLLRVAPDTGAVNARPRTAVFHFNEVIAERQGSGRLADLFIISPSDGAPNVDWDRNSIEIRPRRGWRPNTTYTVTLLPGLTDLRGNVRTEGATVVFSTGPEIATSVVRGIVFDWVAGRPSPLAQVEAVSRPDSTVYVGRADSAGNFTIPNVPAGQYTVRGVIDANRNRALDPRELWDSVNVTVRDSAHVELLTHAHDTVPPRIDRVAVRDSFTLRVSVDRPLDTAMTIDASVFNLLAADSTPVAIIEARPAQVYEREQAERDRARADSIARAAPPPTTDPGIRPPEERAPPIVAVVPSRPSPTVEIIIVLAQPLRPGATYRLKAGLLRGLMGTSGPSERTFTLPKAPERPPGDSIQPTGTPPIPPPASPPVPPPGLRR
jgi:hypothetical protein